MNNWDIASLVASGLQDANAGYRGERGGYADAAMQDMEARRKKKASADFITSLLGHQVQAPNFSGPSAPGYSGAAPNTDQSLTYDGPLAGIMGQKNTAALAPLLSGLEPEAAQSIALPLLLKQFEQKPVETYAPGTVGYAQGDYSKPLFQVPVKPDRPEATPDIIQTATYLFPNDPVKRNAYIMQNSPSAVKSIFAPKAVKPSSSIAIPHPGSGY